MPPEKQIINPVSTLDLSATFADLVGTQPLLRQHGRSLMPLLKYPDAGREFALNEWELLPVQVLRFVFTDGAHKNRQNDC